MIKFHFDMSRRIPPNIQSDTRQVFHDDQQEQHRHKDGDCFDCPRGKSRVKIPKGNTVNLIKSTSSSNMYRVVVKKTTSVNAYAQKIALAHKHSRDAVALNCHAGETQWKNNSRPGAWSPPGPFYH
jgi:hypothetical protein